jgi:hypothetical protein
MQISPCAKSFHLGQKSDATEFEYDLRPKRQTFFSTFFCLFFMFTPTPQHSLYIRALYKRILTEAGHFFDDRAR